MKLYYSPGACSLAPHIVLREAGLQFELEKVDLGTKKTDTGADYRTVNPKGYVPTLQLDNGEVLTEASVVMQYIADKVPEKQLAPAAGTMERYRVIEWLNFISTEVHKTLGMLFKPGLPEETKQMMIALAGTRLDLVEKQLQGHDYLTGNQFTVADAYLSTVLGWSRMLHFDLARWPTVQAYLQRVAARPAVQAAMTAEGLTGK